MSEKYSSCSDGEHVVHIANEANNLFSLLKHGIETRVQDRRTRYDFTIGNTEMSIRIKHCNENSTDVSIVIQHPDQSTAVRLITCHGEGEDDRCTWISSVIVRDNEIIDVGINDAKAVMIAEETTHLLFTPQILADGY